MVYNPREIESKWRDRWEEEGTNRVYNKSDRPKFYVLDMFPYPSGAGLHVGHPLGYIASDIISRFKRMKGYNVLHPMGFDAFGLPAEQYAIQTGVHPAKSTAENIKRYKAQLLNLGLSYDWSREVITSDPNYYKWTQWIFIQLFEHYYDLDADKARPVSALIESFERKGSSGVRASHSYEGSFTAEHWNALSRVEKDRILMNYRLAYRKETYVNWCEELGTVLANDEVKDGVSERGGFPVVRKPMLQWSLRITAYAERLLGDLDALEWSNSLKTMQRNWIGKSEGARIYFKVAHSDHHIEIFTTRPDTIFGATFMVLAPEHPLVDEICTEEQKQACEDYRVKVSSRSEIERKSETQKISGVFTGAYADHPFKEEVIPIWISEYVLMDYGTGAIMAVPSDDERDRNFARHFNIDIIPVVDKSGYPDADIHDKVGVMINSGFMDGMQVSDAIRKAIEMVESKGIGRGEIQYKLRDANFSRQRYWGEPFPIIYDNEGVAEALSLSDLPLELPEIDDFKPATDARSPLAKADEWLNLPQGKTRETDTMPGFAGSSWYFLRYMDPHNDRAFAGEEALRYWRDVDLYIGGTEHAVGHLLYARFWHKFLHDIGLVPTKEPFKKLINQGMIQGVIESIFLLKEKKDGKQHFISSDMLEDLEDDDYTVIPVHVDFVKDYGTEKSYLDKESVKQFINWRPENKGALFQSDTGIYDSGLVEGREQPDFKLYTYSEIGKMSKRYFNVVNPDDVVEEYGADCFRMYEMFLGPVEQSKPWDTNGIDGVSKFLRRFWSLFHDSEGNWIVEEAEGTEEEKKILHQAIKNITEDIERFSFNTCISHFMICTNDLKKLRKHSKGILESLVQLIAPFAPHLGEELWEKLGHKSSVMDSVYPVFDPEILKKESIEYPIAINGKKRGMASFPADATPADIQAEVTSIEEIQKWLLDKEVKRIIVVPKRMVNIVV